MGIIREERSYILGVVRFEQYVLVRIWRVYVGLDFEGVGLGDWEFNILVKIFRDGMNLFQKREKLKGYVKWDRNVRIVMVDSEGRC